MMKTPLVSVVVVSYNQSQYIEENLESIKNQTYSNIELIVSDDASTDNSVETFETWLKENDYSAKKNFHQLNTGLATVLNECIAMATGKYIKLIAADDFLHPEYVEKCVQKLEELKDEYGMVFTHTYTIDENGNTIKDIADYDILGNIDPYIFRKELLKSNRIAALTVLMKAKVLRETGEYDSRFIIEDYYRWLKINEKYLIAYIPERLAYYRIHPQNISKVKAKKIEMETLQLQMMFDKEGVVKDRINRCTRQYYFVEKKLPLEYINAYQQYPFHTKKVYFDIKNKFPVLFYKILSHIQEMSKIG